MLKTRLVGVLIIKNEIVVQSIGFNRFLPVGAPEIAIEHLNRWGIDEIVSLDIDATPMSLKPKYQKIETFSKHCQVPLTVGGGISDIRDLEKIIRLGADKVVINTAAALNPSLITQGAKIFGSQCIMVSIDCRRSKGDKYETFVASGKRPSGWTPSEHARMAEDKGAGEILLTSMDRDGGKNGFDLDLIRQVVGAVSIPVIVCGGVGHPRHFSEAMQYSVSAVAAANFFHYTEHSAITAKRYLEEKGIQLRLDTYADYDGFKFDEDGRLAKVSDATLDQLRFEYTPEEII